MIPLLQELSAPRLARSAWRASPKGKRWKDVPSQVMWGWLAALRRLIGDRRMPIAVRSRYSSCLR